MTEQLQLRGGSNAQNNAFTGAPREVTVDTTFHQLRVHDGQTPGGTVVGGALGMLFKGEIGPGDWNSIAPNTPDVGDAWLVVGTITNFPGAPPDPTTGELVVYSETGWINVGSELMGPPGPEGPPGPSATVDAGTTTTLSAGSDATVTNVGTTSAAVFNFGIPQGERGAQGPPGQSGGSILDFKGEKATPEDLPSSGNEDGDTWYVASTDKYYVWNGTEWITTGSGTPSTSDLQGVCDNGDVTTTGATFGSNGNFSILANGRFEYQPSGAYGKIASSFGGQGSVLYGKQNDNGDDAWSLRGDGSGNFTGRIYAGTTNLPSIAFQAFNSTATDPDSATIYANNYGGGNVWLGFGGGASTSRIGGDGSASFGSSDILSDGRASFLNANASCWINYKPAANTFNIAGSSGSDPGSPSWYVLPDGSAFFNQYVQTGGDPYSGANVGSIISGGSGVVACMTNDGSAYPLWRGHQEGNATPTSQIDVLGSATFAGRVNIGNTSLIKIGLQARNSSSANSTIYAYNSTAGGPVIQVWDSTNTATQVDIRENGSATFTGTVVSGSNPTAASSNVGASLSQDGLFYSRAADGSYVWIGAKDGQAAITSSINSAGNAIFAGTVTSDRADAYAFQVNYGGNVRGGIWNANGGAILYLNDNIDNSNVTLNGLTGAASFNGIITTAGYNLESLPTLP